MSIYTKVRLLLGLAAIFVFIYLIDGPPCLGNAGAYYKANNLRIFQDNRELLDPPDKSSLGKNLVVPKLISSQLEKVNIWGVFPSSLFEEVESIGRRHLSAENSQETQSKHYIVQEGDTLWTIAAEKLGNPSRYKEISELNADVLKNENDLTIGMRLSLPDR